MPGIYHGTMKGVTEDPEEWLWDRSCSSDWAGDDEQPGAGSRMELMVPGVPLQISPLPAPPASHTLLQHPGKLLSSLLPLLLTGFAAPLRGKKLFPESAVFPENGGSQALQIPHPLSSSTSGSGAASSPKERAPAPDQACQNPPALPGWRRSSAPVRGAGCF